MNAPANTIDKADEEQLLATIDRWIEREVAPGSRNSTTPTAGRPSSSSR